MNRYTDKNEQAWGDYVPRKGHRGTPRVSDIRQYVRDTQSNPALRLKIVSELRERSSANSSSLFGMGALGLAVLAIFSTILAGLEVSDALRLSVVYSVGGLLIVLIAFPLALYSDARSRQAASWLAAYLESEATRERIAPTISRSRGRNRRPSRTVIAIESVGHLQYVSS